jgi:LPS-assembly protein
VNKQVDISSIWGITPNTNLIARWNYSLEDSKDLDVLGGFEYGSCCWRFRSFVSRKSGDEANTINFEIELNGLGRFGADAETLLKERVYGYRLEDD